MIGDGNGIVKPPSPYAGAHSVWPRLLVFCKWIPDASRMAPKSTERRSPCPAAFTLDLVGDRWTMLIVRDLLLRGKQRYRDFLEGGENIATNVLADRLAKLEAAGIVDVTPDPDDRRAKRYRPTQKGRELTPLLVELMIFGGRHDPKSPFSKTWLKRAESDREETVRRILADLDAKQH